MRPGVCAELEDAANALLKESLEGVFSHKAKADILTPWKDAERHRREVYISGHPNPEDDRSAGISPGVPERHVRQGMFRRVANKSRPDLNSRDGMAANSRYRTKTARAWDAGDTMTIFALSGDTITLEEYRQLVVPDRSHGLTRPSESKVLYLRGEVRGHPMLDVQTLRELFRQLQQWHSIYESDGIDTITGPGGEQFCLWDIDYLYGELHRLPKRQREAIELYLVQNMREADAAVAMGVSATNPIGIYATVGLGKIVDMIEAGDLPRFREQRTA